MYTTPVRVCKECSLKCQRAEALVRAISQGNADLVQASARVVAPCRCGAASHLQQRYVSLGQNANFFVGFFPPITLAASMGRADIVSLLLQVRAPACDCMCSRGVVTRAQGGASVAAAVEVSDSMLFLRCSVCTNVIPACDDTSEHRFCSRCRAVTHMPKLDAAAWDYAGVTPLHAALSREAPPDVALQVTCRMPALPVRS
jgi:hypothetical protein